MTITLILLIITIAASFYAWNREDIYHKWMMTPYRISRNKEYYRFITSGFIHSGYVHLGFNMFSFYSFGRFVEMNFGELPYGEIKYLLLYVLGIVVSDIPTYLKFKNNSSYHSLGASGAVSAVIFSSIIMDPLLDLRLFFIPLNGFIFGLIYLIYSYYQAKNSTDNINHDAHFYGAIFGIVYTIVLIPEIVPIFFERLSQWRLF